MKPKQELESISDTSLTMLLKHMEIIIQNRNEEGSKLVSHNIVKNAYEEYVATMVFDIPYKGVIEC